MPYVSILCSYEAKHITVMQSFPLIQIVLYGIFIFSLISLKFPKNSSLVCIHVVSEVTHISCCLYPGVT